jgi:3-deoxy-D-manno-octulosonic-acid transferase
MPTTSWSYRSALRLGTALIPALGRFNSKLQRGNDARNGAGDRLLEWARWNRDSSRPLAWFHAASVGEGLQAESVLRELRQFRPDCQIIFTHFSPSAEGFARGLNVDLADYLPYDLPGTVHRLLASLEPDLLVFAKSDLWPELSTAAATTGTQVCIVAGTVTPGSARLHWPARPLLKAGYQVVTAAAAVSAEDAGRLARLGVPQDRIQILGDPRYDSVAQRVRTVVPDDPLVQVGRGAPTMVAGSTWPRDEEVILSAFVQVYARHPEARLIVVPHEPTAEHLDALSRRGESSGLPSPVRLGHTPALGPIITVDRLGVLATLYGSGTMAYVGGGYGNAGLHSVLEPAAWGIPVAFGPRWRNSRDASLLLAAGAGTALPAASGGRAQLALAERWEHWIVDDEQRRSQGERARAVVETGLGGARRSAEMLAELISARRLRRSRPGVRSVPPSAP